MIMYMELQGDFCGAEVCESWAQKNDKKVCVARIG